MSRRDRTSRIPRRRERWTATSLLAGIAVLATLAAGCEPRAGVAGTDAQEIWRFAIEETRGSVQDAYAQRFKELVEERTDGAIRLKVYPYGTLGTSDQITEQLHAGTIEFAMASPGHLGKLIPEVQVFLLHFILSDDEEVNQRVLDDPDLLRTFDALYEEKGLRLLDIFSEGWMVWTTNRPIRRPEDFRGVKFRTMTSPLLLAAYSAYQASPTPLPYSEVYSGLQLAMIDGQVNPVFAIEEMSFDEVSDFMIFPNHALFITSAVTGEAFYNELPPERRELIRSVVQELQDEIFHIQRRFNRERLDTITERNPELEILRLTEEERDAFREASLPVRDTFIDTVGPEGEKVLELILETVRKEERPPGAGPSS